MRPILLAALLALPIPLAAQTALEELPVKDRLAWIEAAKAEGRTGIARKTRPVDARPAIAGEVIVTMVGGVEETRSKPAAQGDMVVRNRCDESGNEEIIVSAEKFPTRYGPVAGDSAIEGYAEYRPSGTDMVYAVVPAADGEFAIEAPWGELQRVLPGDAIVQIPEDPADTYRIDARAFECTYEIVTPAGG